jgi:hypothetical protein
MQWGDCHLAEERCIQSLSGSGISFLYIYLLYIYIYISITVVCILQRGTNCAASELVLGVVLETSARSWRMKYIEAINLTKRTGCCGWGGRELNAEHDKVCPGGREGQRWWVQSSGTPLYVHLLYVYVILLYRHLFWFYTCLANPNTLLLSVLMISCYHVNEIMLRLQIYIFRHGIDASAV